MKDLDTLLHIIRDLSLPAMIAIGVYIAFYAGKTYSMLSNTSKEMKEFKKKACVGIQQERNKNIKQNERLSVIETRIDSGVCKAEAMQVAKQFKAPEDK